MNNLLATVAAILNFKASRQDIEDANAMGRVLHANPLDMEAARIFHEDALPMAGVTPSLDHPRYWDGFENAQYQQHPMHEAYRAAVRHRMERMLEPVRQRIEDAALANDDNQLYLQHHTAADIAADHGDADLQTSHQYAGRHRIRPYLSGNEHDNRYIWRSGSPAPTYDRQHNIPAEMMDHLPDSSSFVNGSGWGPLAYPTQREAWDAFHQAHRRWREAQNG